MADPKDKRGDLEENNQSSGSTNQAKKALTPAELFEGAKEHFNKQRKAVDSCFHDEESDLEQLKEQIQAFKKDESLKGKIMTSWNGYYYGALMAIMAQRGIKPKFPKQNSGVTPQKFLLELVKEAYEREVK
ncbi:hypothetical protein [Vibrio campbellii]|uniref:hypothetical protein n=1 Tax=Vibrio campbellii TaxID=680 RepID=UPI00168D508E|nr:hypothetical protein [Vibrio campbellii]